MEKKIKGAAATRQAAQKETVLEQLRRMPVISTACDNTRISRASFYRMRNEDEVFRAAAEKAIAEGVAFISDLGESQLVELIKEGNFQVIKFWLQTHRPEYSRKVEISGTLALESNALTGEDQQIIEEALRRVFPTGETNKSQDDEQK